MCRRYPRDAGSLDATGTRLLLVLFWECDIRHHHACQRDLLDNVHLERNFTRRSMCFSQKFNALRGVPGGNFDEDK
jgi:G:T-mismatch repair DNA endonuclease (very short patch repair protein)